MPAVRRTCHSALKPSIYCPPLRRCRECIYSWLQSKKQCPLCRSAIAPNSLAACITSDEAAALAAGEAARQAGGAGQGKQQAAEDVAAAEPEGIACESKLRVLIAEVRARVVFSACACARPGSTSGIACVIVLPVQPKPKTLNPTPTGKIHFPHSRQHTLRLNTLSLQPCLSTPATLHNSWARCGRPTPAPRRSSSASLARRSSGCSAACHKRGSRCATHPPSLRPVHVSVSQHCVLVSSAAARLGTPGPPLPLPSTCHRDCSHVVDARHVIHPRPERKPDAPNVV